MKVVLLVAGLSLGVVYGQTVPLLSDTAFKEGFGAAWAYGKTYTGGQRWRQGFVREYRDIAPLQVQLIPDGPVSETGVREHPWDFEEGLHHNYTNRLGRYIGELHDHRLVVNHILESNTAEALCFAQYNNEGLSPGARGWNARLIKRISCDRRGAVRVYYNTYNDIRNAAINHTGEWARDTWPHLLLLQTFKDNPKLCGFNRMDLRLTFQVDQLRQITPWPSGTPGAGPASMNLKFMFFLRRVDDPARGLFAGVMMYTSRAENYRPHAALDQWGTVFYRDSITRLQPMPERGKAQRVEVEVKALVRAALKRAGEFDPRLSDNPDDYYLSNFTVGWEGLGHWEAETLLSGLSLDGTPSACE